MAYPSISDILKNFPKRDIIEEKQLVHLEDIFFVCKECNKRSSRKIDSKKYNMVCTSCMAKKAKEKRETSIKGCYICGKGFLGKREIKTCSPKCKKKYTEKKSFYKGLKQANLAVVLSETRVYGQGRTEFINTNKLTAKQLNKSK